MKDVILITTCISVTDAYYYDIKNDFNCLKMLLRLSSLARTERNVANNNFTASSSFIKNKREAKWLESISWRSKSFQFI